MVVLDLETVASPEAADLVQPDKRLKDPEKIAASIAERAEKASLYPWTCQIVALGWCEETDDVERVEICGNEAHEKTAIEEFLARIVDPRTSAVRPIVTFNGHGFDLPVLMARARLLGVRCPELSIDRYRSPHPDLLQILTFKGALGKDGYRSLAWFARLFGLNTDDAFSGAFVAQLVAENNWDAIKAHCASDVRLCRQLAERLGVMRKRPGVTA